MALACSSHRIGGLPRSISREEKKKDLRGYEFYRVAMAEILEIEDIRNENVGEINEQGAS